MTKFERVQAALKREPTDRPPYAFWRHFPDVDRSAAALAQSTLRFHERYGSDFLKVTPTGGYAVEDWGCVESDEVAPDGHRPCARHAVTSFDDWKKIRPLRLESTGWGAHLETILRCVVDRRADCSTLPTIFSPLSLARKLSGERLNYDLKENPQAVTDALEAITETILTFADACFLEGAEGIFYSVMAASTDLHTEDEYRRFGEPYDRRILEHVRPKSKLTVLHCHGSNLDVRRPRCPARPCVELGRPAGRALASRRAAPRARRGDRRARPVGGAQGRDAGCRERRGAGCARADGRTRGHSRRGLRAAEPDIRPGPGRADQVHRRPGEARSHPTSVTARFAASHAAGRR